MPTNPMTEAWTSPEAMISDVGLVGLLAKRKLRTDCSPVDIMSNLMSEAASLAVSGPAQGWTKRCTPSHKPTTRDDCADELLSIFDCDDAEYNHRIGQMESILRAAACNAADADTAFGDYLLLSAISGGHWCPLRPCMSSKEV